MNSPPNDWRPISPALVNQEHTSHQHQSSVTISNKIGQVSLLWVYQFMVCSGMSVGIVELDRRVCEELDGNSLQIHRM